jgi:hypothetical protein
MILNIVRNVKDYFLKADEPRIVHYILTEYERLLEEYDSLRGKSHIRFCKTYTKHMEYVRAMQSLNMLIHYEAQEGVTVMDRETIIAVAQRVKDRELFLTKGRND